MSFIYILVIHTASEGTNTRRTVCHRNVVATRTLTFLTGV